MKNKLKIINKTEPVYSSAARLEILPGHLSELFRGKRNISPLLALKLEDTLNINAEFWLQLQNRYDLTILRKARTESAKKQKPIKHSEK